MFRAIIFDWHGVFDRTTFAMFLDELALLVGRSPEETHRLIAEDERLYTSGQLEPRIFWNNLRERLRLSNDDLISTSALLLSYAPNSELWKLLPKIPPQITLGILSDCPPDKIETIKRMAPLHYFKATHFSGEIKLTKKNPEFFFGIAKALGKYIPECLYVDDSAKHIATARNLGFHTHKFESAEGFSSLITKLVVP